MAKEKSDGGNKDALVPAVQQNGAAAQPCDLKIKKRLKVAIPCLGKLRPAVGQCCHQCTPDSQPKKLRQSHHLGFHNLLHVSETHTRFRGWLVRRVCCVLFVSGCKVYPSPAKSRAARVCESNRVTAALAAEHDAPEGADGRRQRNHLSSFLPLVNTCISPGLLRLVGWAMLKMFTCVFDSVQLNLNHLQALQRASEEASPLVYVYVRQSAMDAALLPLVLFCHGLRVPYSLCPLAVGSSTLRWILRNVGVVPLPPSTPTEQEAEADHLYSPVMTSLLRELLHEGQALSVGVAAESGGGGQWLARIRQLIKEGSVPDVTLVPVGISYDRVPEISRTRAGPTSVLRWLWSLLWRSPGGSVRIHLAQPFSLKEMCDSGRCRVDKWLPLQDLLPLVVLNSRSDSESGCRRTSWLLPSHYARELKEAILPERDLCIAIISHLIFSATSCMAVMSTGLLSSLLLHRHRKGVTTSVLCRDVAWLTEELLFRNRDVGFTGTAGEVARYALSLLAPHLVVAAVPPGKDPFIVIRPTAAAAQHLHLLAHVVRHAFILEAVGACAVSAMLCEVASSGVSSRAGSDGLEGGGEVKDDMEFDVVLCQSELTERALQLCHLLPLGFMPPCQSAQSFALDAVDSLVRCGILIMEEVPKDVPICDFWKKEGALAWTTNDGSEYSDSDCEEQDLHSYKISQPSQCPEMLLFLCSLLAGHLRAVCWTTLALDLLHTPLPEAECVSQIHSHLRDTANKKQQYESCSEEAAHAALRTLIDLGVLVEERRPGGVFLDLSTQFRAPESRQRVHRFVSQYLFS